MPSQRVYNEDPVGDAFIEDVKRFNSSLLAWLGGVQYILSVL